MRAPRGLTLHDVLSPLRANLTWSSAILRHAVRAVVLTVVAIAISLLWWSVYAHWLTITVALTMQPYFAATWQRALERIGGTCSAPCSAAPWRFCRRRRSWHRC